jgi:hypothetical protein
MSPAHIKTLSGTIAFLTGAMALPATLAAILAGLARR